MIEIVDKFLEKYNLKNPENTFLVGFSGGCDSLCLLDILNELSKKYGFKVVALHLNHNWRGEESNQEEINCKKFCGKKNIEFVSEILTSDVPKTEDCAREARYEFFLRISKNYNNSKLFTGHTSTDNAETLIYRMIKGTGVTGLQGILPYRNEKELPVYRPVLELSRAQTEAYCKEKGFIPNTDSSNFNIDYKRNFIRQKIMPLLMEINPKVENSINNLSKLAISREKILKEYISQINEQIYEGDKILTEKFKMLLPEVQDEIVYNIFLNNEIDYDFKKISNVLEFIRTGFNSKSGLKCSLTKDLWVFVSSKYIYLVNEISAEKIKEEVQITKEGEYFLGDKVFSIEKSKKGTELGFPSESSEIAYVNMENLQFDYTLRTRRDGDFIMPFGMKGQMKLKKYLNSKGIPQHEKDKLIMLCKGAEVLWVVGVGLSEKLRVVNRPTHVIKLKSR